MAENLVLHQACRKQLMSALVKGFSLKEADRMSSLPSKTVRAEIETKMKALGGPLTRPECDRVMRLLSIACPSSGITAQEAHNKLELYFLLLHEAGVTGNMLAAAAKGYVMAPTKGKPHWFPDAGQLAELCADDIRARRDALAALNGALEGLDGSGAAAAEPEHGFDAGAHMRELAERMRVGPARAAASMETHRPARFTPSTARPATDAKELVEHINRKSRTA